MPVVVTEKLLATDLPPLPEKCRLNFPPAKFPFDRSPSSAKFVSSQDLSVPIPMAKAKRRLFRSAPLGGCWLFDMQP